MRNDNVPDRLDELASESLNDGEVREILQRLSAQEFGGSELPTVGAVCDATGASPQLVGRILAEIRQENLHERFGEKLETHEAKIVRLEAETKRLGRRTPPMIENEIHAELRSMAEERVQSRKMSPVALVIGLVVALVIITVVGPCVTLVEPEDSTGVPPNMPRISKSLTSGETLTMDSRGEVFVETRNGGRRAPTPEEREEAQSLPLLRDASRSSRQGSN